MPGLFAGTSLERPVTCEACGKPLDVCACPRDAQGALCRPQDQPARVQLQKRRGKWVTVVTGLDPHATDLKALAKRFKHEHATGGCVTDDGIELRGDCRDAVVASLKAMGYPAKPSGGASR